MIVFDLIHVFKFQLGDMVVTPYLTSENGKEYIKGKALALKYDVVEQ